MVKNRLFSQYSVLVLFSLLFVACGFREKTEITIVSPAESARVSTVQVDPNLATYQTVSVGLESNRPDVSFVTARIYVNETPQGTCTLMLNLESACEVPMAVTGDQAVRFEVDKLDGTIISDQVTFLWMPYAGLDLVGLSLANVMNSNNPTDGYTLLGIILLLIFVPVGLFVGRKSGLATALVIIWTITIVGALVLLHVNPAYAYSIFGQIIATVGFISFLGLVGFLASAGYMFRGGGHVELTTRAYYPDGRLAVENLYKGKESFQFGPGKYISNPSPQEVRAIAQSLAIMIPGVFAQAKFLLGQFPDPRERQNVINLIEDSGGDADQIIDAIEVLQNDPNAQVSTSKEDMTGLFGWAFNNKPRSRK